MGTEQEAEQAMQKLKKAMQEGGEDGLRIAGLRVKAAAQKKLGHYQPGWAKLKPESIRQKHLSRTKDFYINEKGQVRIKFKDEEKTKKFLDQYGRNAKVFGGERQFQASGTSADGPLIDTGLLRESITTDESELSNGVNYVGTSQGVKKYAAAHEFGSTKRKIPPRPYLRPALEENREEVIKDIRQAVIDALEGAFR